MKQVGSHNPFLTYLLYAGGFFLLIIAFFGLRYVSEIKYRPDSLVKRTNKVFHMTGIQCVTTSEKVFSFVDQKNGVDWKRLNSQLSDIGADILILKDDSIIYWNNNQIPVNLIFSMTNKKLEVLFPGSSIYEGIKRIRGKYTVGVFFPLTKKTLPYGVKIEQHVKTGKNRHPIRQLNITLIIKPGVLPPQIISILFLLYATLVLFVILLLSLLYKKFEGRITQHHVLLFIFSFFIDLILIRVLLYYIGFPSIFKSSFWVSGQITNIPAFKSPGDLVLNLIIFFVGLMVLVRYFKKPHHPWKSLVLLKLFLTQLVLFILPVLLFVITEGFLQNGGLILFPENVYFSLTGFIRLSLLLVVNLLLYLWIDAFLCFYKRKETSFWQIILTLTTVALLFLWLTEIENTIIFLTYGVILFLTVIFWFIERQKKPYFHSILTILVLSLAAAFILNMNELENRNAHQRFTANLLTQKKDPFLQYILKNQSEAILSDTNIIKTILSRSEDKEHYLSNYLNKKYFRGMLSAYSRQVTLCEPGQQLEIQPDNKVIGCDAFFRQLQGEVVDSSKDFELSLVNNSNESIYYLATFRFPNLLNNKAGVNLYIEFYTTIIPKGLGYPELLQDAGAEKLHLSGYSFAFYEQGKLEYKFGDYLYPIDFSDFKRAPFRTFFHKDGYTHYMLPSDKTEILLVSRPSLTLSGWLLPFSLLFILSGFLLLVYISFKYGKQILETLSYSFSTRLQLTFFSTMLIVFFVLTAIILYYFNTNNQQSISNNLKEKTHSVMIELQHKLAPYGNTALQNKQETQSYLQKLSMVFFSDINLYDNAGELIVSSRPEIFNRELQSRLISPKAFTEIEKEHKLFYLGKEKIRHVEFYSSYAPFILDNGITAGIINLPYFARQSELQHTYYQMLTNLINLFVITGMLGMLLMIYLSRLLTRPLNILQHKITSVSIERQNEKIEWNRNDEIGKLIKAYNQMVEKLEESARLIKYSAREKAWREMARQIAHEIRNPLTPMKLNVQYLQKLYSAKDPSFDEKFKSVSRSLINQIDTMNEVAGMFSDFSKIKIPINEKANLIEAITSTATLFRKSYKIKINIDSEYENVEVNTSMQDLLRIFNNLLKNAVQSMENTSENSITIQVFQQKKYAEVRVTDTGRGIDEEDKEHIFQPYFTTKSKGTGLGLAIVKNLMTETGGEILFISEKGLGTTFVLKFPLSMK